MYFLQADGEHLDYARAQYGPYAENLNHVLHDIEGHYLTGYTVRPQYSADCRGTV